MQYRPCIFGLFPLEPLPGHINFDVSMRPHTHNIWLCVCVCVCPMYSVFLCVIGLWHLGVKPSIPMTKALAGRYGRCCLTIIKQASCFKWNVNTHASVWVVSAHTHTHTETCLFIICCSFLCVSGQAGRRIPASQDDGMENIIIN